MGEGHEEQIFVSVRIRPLNGKEISRNDVSDWECINDNTIIYKNANISVPERSMYPSAYTFDRVFSCHCSTGQVYEEGAKEIALSAVTGINSSIFAYGQTSSGKTFTMTGITEYTLADIYDYIQKHTERDFLLKFSAMEIYNESVRDLLIADITPLRLLDDPEKGTIVEKLTEEILTDWNHVIELLSICEAQRQSGETSLNETSSRSHQIIRLTIESSAREFLGKDNSSTLVASVNFVDLAGSERASQSLSAGARLKEGCHINRSLLTLGTVIRKLSKGRNGHVPFRDSKLTRILQSSLGGNARTAIICTMSPARSHVEQSRNTLFFANCAKEVITNAQVNVVTSDRAMVKHLQRELARLESELRNPRSTFATSDCAALLREKDLQIEKLKKEIEDLTLQRDVAQSQLQDMLQLAGDDGNSLIRVGLGHYPKLRVMRSPESVNPFPEMSIWVDPPSPNVSVKTSGVSRFSEGKSGNISDDNYINLPDFEEKFLQNNTPSRLLISSTTSHFSESGSSQGLEEIDEQSNGSSEDLCKDVQCIETEVSCTKTQKEFNYQSPEESTEISSMIVAENGDGEDDGELVPPQVKEDRELVSLPVKVNNEVLSPPLEEDRELNYVHPFVVPSPEKKDISSSINSTLTKSRSCKASFMSSLSSSWFDKVENNETTPPNGSEKDFTGRPRDLQKKLSALNYQADMERLSTEGSQSSVMATFDIALEGHNWRTDITGVKETDEFQHDNQVAHSQAKGIEATVNESLKSVKNVGLDPIEDCPKSPSNWCLEFKRVQREIIELWHACNVSLVHRTYFFLLFKGDQTDYIYMEVELRRLSFIKDTFSRGHQTLQDGRTLTPASSMKAICRERRILSKQMRKRLSEEEREDLYHRWGVGLNTKNRRLQLAYRLWTHTQDMDHIADSAFLVAKLVGFVKDGKAPKEMFGLNFAPRRTTRTRTLKRSLISLSCNSHQLEIDTH